jgi:hypothetical protein
MTVQVAPNGAAVNSTDRLHQLSLLYMFENEKAQQKSHVILHNAKCTANNVVQQNILYIHKVDYPFSCTHPQVRHLMWSLNVTQYTKLSLTCYIPCWISNAYLIQLSLHRILYIIMPLHFIFDVGYSV